MSLRINQDKAELRMQKVTVASAVVVTTKFLFGICDCTVDSDVGTGDFSLVLRISTCVPTRTCDRMRIRAWTVIDSFLVCYFQNL